MFDEVKLPDMGPPVDGISADVREEAISRLEEAPVRLAVLFGSFATGEATEGSDIDIAVAYDAAVTDVTGTHLSLVADLTRILGRDDVDVVRLTAVDPRIGVEALENGQLLVGSRGDVDTLRAELEAERRESERDVRTRVAEAERAIEKRLEQREHG